MFDAKYFTGKKPYVYPAAIPRIDALLEEQTTFPDNPLVVINSNFTYGVLTQHRDTWLQQAVQACDKAGFDYLISRHPADTADLSCYHVGGESMYDLIRRGSVFVCARVSCRFGCVVQHIPKLSSHFSIRSPPVFPCAPCLATAAALCKAFPRP